MFVCFTFWQILSKKRGGHLAQITKAWLSYRCQPGWDIFFGSEGDGSMIWIEHLDDQKLGGGFKYTPEV